ncbi:FAD-dependent thymidylate synthase [Wolbachia endosymbiont of Howardula sp.]|uniref:FAD-dependent thymidylate synthase n=1 Tax=Wolbachia endosymbiont of Howardula sp. TaxID=2916816 RepID=UPI00217CCAFB|nr:FAD-dependent thymidylate synthase [Wolbachia endosymbiont of Howardula sp.]UWI83228.1 FAD-dependent thymidylate synthase [Wolbachia endosymbiont of Howardula sp.]
MSKQYSTTKRIIVQDIEDILYQKNQVLDHGFIRVIDYMGSDSAIVQAARVSYGTGTKSINQDEELIKYLMRHCHTTPFEMCEIKFHVKLPIFVARQWIRHRTANINEYSARYSILDNEFYIPNPENIAKQSDHNKQSRCETFNIEASQKIIDSLKKDTHLMYTHYDKFIRQGVAREIARINLTLNYYTQFYWKIDLHNLLHFLRLRAHPLAQYEMRVYAEVMIDIIKKWVPCAYNAFSEYCLDSVCISRRGLEIIRKLIKGEKITKEKSGLGTREWNELMSILKNNTQET